MGYLTVKVTNKSNNEITVIDKVEFIRQYGDKFLYFSVLFGALAISLKDFNVEIIDAYFKR